jgi:hypothetical protein
MTSQRGRLANLVPVAATWRCQSPGRPRKARAADYRPTTVGRPDQEQHFHDKMRLAALDENASELELIKCAMRSMGHDCHVFTDGASLMRELRCET